MCAGLLLFQVYVIFLQPHGTPASRSRDVRVVGEIAGQVTVRQTFQLEANGFDGITLRPSPTGQEHEGPVVLEIAEEGPAADGSADVPLYRLAVEARRVADDSTFTWRFSPVEGSRGKRYALHVSVPSAPFGNGLSLFATRDSVYRGGRLWFDGKEQWGDLLFDTTAARATSFRRFEHALRDKPAWLRSRATLALLLGLYNVALGTILWLLLTARAEPLTPPDAGDRPVRWWRRLPPAVRWGIVGACVLAVAVAYHTLVPRRVRIEAGTVELIDRFPEAARRTTMSSVEQAFDYFDVTWNGQRLRCLLAAPFSRVTFTVDIAGGKELRGWAGMRPDVWQGPGDGSVFRIGVSSGGIYDERFRTDLSPQDRPIDRTFVPFRIDLAKYAGRRVDLVFNTEPGPMENPVGDVALWCEPRIVSKPGGRP
jgi:hypothetical protein